MNIDIILSTRNPSKASQIKTMFEGLPVRILTLEDANVRGEAIEDGKTLEENASKKVRFAWEQTKRWCPADDTGLFIDALGGQPGIHAARWAGLEAQTEEIMRFTLEKLKHIPQGRREATFKTVAAMINPQGELSIFMGEVRGTILSVPRVACQPKMPYSAIFVPDGQLKVWAEMSAGEENAISHRGKAFRQVYNFFKKSL